MTDRVLVLAKVLQVYDNIYYNACRMCNSKIHVGRSTDEKKSSHFQLQVCLKCGEDRDSTQSVQRYRVSLNITDGDTNCDVTVFGTQLERFTGASAQYMHSYLQWMSENNIESGVLDFVLRETFCDKWFLFGFKVQRKIKGRQVRLRDVTDNVSWPQTQNCCSKNLTAWQMTHANDSHSLEITVISLLKHFVHEIIRRRSILTSDESLTENSQLSFVVASSITERNNSDDSFLLLNKTEPYTSPSLGVDLTCVSFPNHSRLSASTEPPCSADQHLSGLHSSLILKEDTAMHNSYENSMQNKPAQGNLAYYSPKYAEKEDCNVQLSMEVRRAGTQDTINSVLLEMDTLDFSDSFSEKNPLSADRDKTIDRIPMRNTPAQDQLNSILDFGQSLDITRDVRNLDLTDDLGEDEANDDFEQDEYFNLKSGCDDTIDVMQDFRKACSATQIPTNHNISSLSQSSSEKNQACNGDSTGSNQICRTSENNFGDTKVAKDFDLQSTLNDSSLLLFDIGHCDKQPVFGALEDSLESADESILLLCPKGVKKPQETTEQTLEIENRSLSVTDTPCGIQNESVPFSDSKNITAFLNNNGKSDTLETHSDSHTLCSRTTENTPASQFHAKPPVKTRPLVEHGQSLFEDCDEFLPESEDLSKFLQDMANDSMTGSDNIDESKPVVLSTDQSTATQNKVTVEDQEKRDIRRESVGEVRNSTDNCTREENMPIVSFVPNSEEIFSQEDVIPTELLHTAKQLRNDENLITTNPSMPYVNSCVVASLSVIENIADVFQKNNPSFVDKNETGCSNMSEDLFGDSLDENELVQTVFGNVQCETENFVFPTTSCKKRTKYSKRKSVCFARKLFHQELISNIDYQMQTTPVSLANNFRTRSCLRRIKRSPLQDRSNVKSNEPVQYSEELFTPSPIGALQSHVRKSCLFQSTPLTADSASPSLFSSPETSITNRISNSCSLRKNRISTLNNLRKKPPNQENESYLNRLNGDQSDCESSLFSNESLFSHHDTALSPRNCSALNDSQRKMSFEDSDFIPSSCPRNNVTSTKFRKIIL